jgi:acyl-CoA synthetase (NDP forming)
MNFCSINKNCVEMNTEEAFPTGLDKMKTHELYPLFFPKSVAIVGVSENMHYGASSFLQALNTLNYSKFGNLYPVNPRHAGKKLHGYTCYPSIESLPETPDYILSGLPAAKTPALLKEAIIKGARFVVVFTSGFNEVSNDEGKALHKEIISILDSDENKDETGRKKTRVIGPNCLGVYNPSAGMAYFNDQHRNVNGRVSVLSQSGGQAINISSFFSERNFPVRMAISVGNMLDLDIAEIFDFYYHDPHTQAIVCYVEGIPENSGRRLFDLIKKITKKKAVLIWKTGRTKASLKAISSHTGSLAGDSKIFSSAMRQAGAILPRSLEALFDAASAIMLSPLPRDRSMHNNNMKNRSHMLADVVKNNVPDKKDPDKKNVDLKAGIIVCGGGFSVDIIDTFSLLGIKKADFSSDTLKKMGEVLPDDINTFIVNPVDMGDKGYDHHVFGKILELCAADENVDFIVTACEPERYARFGQWLNQPNLELKHAEVIKDVREKFQKPIFVIGLAVSRDPEVYSRRIKFSNLMRQLNVPSFPTVERAAYAALSFTIHAKNVANHSMV